MDRGRSVEDESGDDFVAIRGFRKRSFWPAVRWCEMCDAVNTGAGKRAWAAEYRLLTESGLVGIWSIGRPVWEIINRGLPAANHRSGAPIFHVLACRQRQDEQGHYSVDRLAALQYS